MPAKSLKQSLKTAEDLNSCEAIQLTENDEV